MMRVMCGRYPRTPGQHIGLADLGDSSLRTNRFALAGADERRDRPYVGGTSTTGATMNRRLPIAVALLAAASVPAVLTAGADSATGRATTLRLANRIDAIKLVDAAPRGNSPGDLAVLGGTLRAPGSTRVIGHYQGTCTTMKPPTNSECTFTWAVAGGQITTITAYGRNFNGENTVRDAIVGGTGSYRDVRGEGIGKETSGTTGLETFRFTRP